MVKQSLSLEVFLWEEVLSPRAGYIQLGLLWSLNSVSSWFLSLIGLTLIISIKHFLFQRWRDGRTSIQEGFHQAAVLAGTTIGGILRTLFCLCMICFNLFFLCINFLQHVGTSWLYMFFWCACNKNRISVFEGRNFLVKLVALQVVRFRRLFMSSARPDIFLPHLAIKQT